MSCISAARTMSSSWLRARPRRRPTPIACAATRGSATAEPPARRSERICSRTSRTWRSEDRRCQRERARRRSCAIASALDAVGRLVGDPGLAADGAGGEPLGDSRRARAAPSAAGGQRAGLDRAEEGVEACGRGDRRGRRGARRRRAARARDAAAGRRRRRPAGRRRGRPPAAGRAARGAPGCRRGARGPRAGALACAGPSRCRSRGCERRRGPCGRRSAAWSSVLLRVRCTFAASAPRRGFPTPRAGTRRP